MMMTGNLSSDFDVEKGRHDKARETGAAQTDQESANERRYRYAKQILIILATSIGYQNEGLALSWPNTLASDLQTDPTTIFNTTITVQDWQMDMASSAVYIGATLATPVSGWFATRLGRKRTMMISSAPMIASWIIVAVAVNTPMVLLGRFLNGVGCVLQAIAVRSYLVEVSDNEIRGAAGVMPEFMKGIGAILIIAVGIALPWYYTAIFGGFHFLFFAWVIVPLLPESPTYLAVNGRTDEARKVLRQLKGPYADVDHIMRDLEKRNKRVGGSNEWRVLIKPNIVKKIIMLLGLFLIGNLCGSEVIRGNATRMLQSSGLALDKDISTIIVFTVLLSGNVTQVFVLDRIGRRRCLMLSLSLLMLSYALLGTYTHIRGPEVDIISLSVEGNTTILDMTILEDTMRAPEVGIQWAWVPTACLMVAAFSLSLGIGPIPWLLTSEYFPTNIRPKVLAVVIIIFNMIAVCAFQLYSPMQNFLTTAGLFWCYSCIAGIGILYTNIFVTETKGISIG